MDLGIEGFNETIDVLTKNNIQFIGVGNNKYILNYIIIEKRGIKLGFLGYLKDGTKYPIPLWQIEQATQIGFSVEEELKK